MQRCAGADRLLPAQPGGSAEDRGGESLTLLQTEPQNIAVHCSFSPSEPTQASSENTPDCLSACNGAAKAYGIRATGERVKTGRKSITGCHRYLHCVPDLKNNFRLRFTPFFITSPISLFFLKN